LLKTRRGGYGVAINNFGIGSAPQSDTNVNYNVAGHISNDRQTYSEITYAATGVVA
jgi:hypothetical protein